MELRRRVELRGVDLREGIPSLSALRSRPIATAPIVKALTRPVRHRATTSTGAVVDDPSAADLTALVAEVGRSGRDAFVIVERRVEKSTKRPGEYYLQAVRQGNGWAVEVRAGGADRHFRASVGDDQVGDVFMSWLESSKRWHALDWQHVTRHSSWEQGLGLAGVV